MKKVHFWSCLLLIIVMTACGNKEEGEGSIPIPSGEFFFKEKTYTLHYCSIRRNKWLYQIYDASFYSHDKTVRLEVSFINNENGIPTGFYENRGLSVNTYEQKVNARLSLRHITEGEPLSGDLYFVEFKKNSNGSYDLRISPKDYPEEYLVYWSGKIS